MRIHSVTPIDAAAGLHAIEAGDYARLRKIGPPAPLRGDWTPIPVASAKPVRRGRAARLRDIASIGGMTPFPALSQRARDALAEALGSRVEWLPLQMPEPAYCIMNVLRSISPLDQSQAVFERRFGDAVSNISVYAFDEPAVADELVFKVSDWPYHVLVTDAFVDIVQAHGLQGFHFWTVWDSQVRPFKYWPATTEVAERKDVYGPGGLLAGFEAYWPEQWRLASSDAP